MTHPHPVAASIAIHALLLGPPRPARVLGAFTSAAYVGLEGSLRAAGPSVVALLTTRAVRLPNALLVAGPPPWTAGLSDSAEIGAGEVRVGALVLRVTRWWAPRRPRNESPAGATVLPERAAWLRTELDRHGTALPAPAGRALDALTRSWHALDRTGAFAAAERLVGLGPGLTPAGDDALAGFLLAANHLSPAGHGRLAADLARHVCARASTRTTALSATLLHHAARGEAAPEVVDVLDALLGHGDLPSAVARLLRVGHTSGADLAHGLSAGARAGDSWRAAA